MAVHRGASRVGSAAVVCAVVAFAAVLFTPSRVAAFELSGCNLTLQSIDREDQPLDTAVGNAVGGEGGTFEDPFRVDYDGTVEYSGDTDGQVITNASWHIDVYFVPTPARGSGPNDEQETSAEGRIQVNRTIPFRTSGLFFLSGELTGDGGACRGSFWVRIGGEPADPPPPTTIPFWIALVIILAGILVLWSARPSRLVTTQVREVR